MTLITTAAPAAPAAARFRRQFPALDKQVHLASCSLGAPSNAMAAAMSEMATTMGRGAGAWPQFEGETERARLRFAGLIGAQPEQIAIVPNASIGAYQVISALSLDHRDEVATSVEEFPSIAHVWLAQHRRGARVSFVPRPEPAGPEANAAAYGVAMSRRTALVSVPLVTYLSGARLPVREIADRAHRLGARVFVDAYQAVGVLPVDVRDLDCDFLVAGAQKYLLGLPGVAFLYVRDSAATDLDPVLTGWFGRVDPFAFDPRRLDFPATARRFETGSPAVPALYAANAGLDLLSQVHSAEVERHVTTLAQQAAEQLMAQGERLVIPEPEDRGAHLALLDATPTVLAAWLSARGISVSPRGPVVRLAFHYYNNSDDVAALCAALAEYRQRFPPCG
jgi:selenocysteine lyase/cysteine desulfurase